jgi:hypothetical protein
MRSGDAAPASTNARPSVRTGAVLSPRRIIRPGRRSVWRARILSGAPVQMFYLMTNAPGVSRGHRGVGSASAPALVTTSNRRPRRTRGCSGRPSGAAARDRRSRRVSWDHPWLAMATLGGPSRFADTRGSHVSPTRGALTFRRHAGSHVSPTRGALPGTRIAGSSGTWRSRPGAWIASSWARR